ncbi:hypothetical protein [Klebsiella quasipneumoniae]|uniref:hypothetical protein n=1 Tax=Klebsiella quasipneumoniae TaxID=1463165 RepID=UPI00296413D0|nr:hypothetical protein [Klebsiella quasipneumoniae]
MRLKIAPVGFYPAYYEKEEGTTCATLRIWLSITSKRISLIVFTSHTSATTQSRTAQQAFVVGLLNGVAKTHGVGDQLCGTREPKPQRNHCGVQLALGHEMPVSLPVMVEDAKVIR